jgi:hypothetical protein
MKSAHIIAILATVCFVLFYLGTVVLLVGKPPTTYKDEFRSLILAEIEYLNVNLDRIDEILERDNRDEIMMFVQELTQMQHDLVGTCIACANAVEEIEGKEASMEFRTEVTKWLKEGIRSNSLVRLQERCMEIIEEAMEGRLDRLEPLPQEEVSLEGLKLMFGN